MLKVLISSVPWTDTNSPLMAPALLKSCLIKAGITAVALDLNAEIKSFIDQHAKRSSFLKFFLTESIDRDARQDVLDLVDHMARRLLSFNTEWIGLSLLTYLSQIPTRWICFRIRQLSPATKIVIGGPGAFVTLKSTDNFSRDLKRQGLIDFYISGDAELSLPALIQGNTDYAGINQHAWQQLTDLDSQQPIPDFDDFNWDLYSAKHVSILGSRGCVRKCTFCDVHEHWSKYQWRSGDQIFAEIRNQSEKYGINFFNFSDSLVNGNQQEFRKLITLLADYNKDRPKQDWVRWTGFFIIRPQAQMKESEWELMAKSGADMLMVGVESFVEHIRYHIKKKFSNQDLDYALDMGKKYSINFTLLMIVGYVTETEADFQAGLQWLRDHRQYAGAPIHTVQIGSGLGILPGTWLERNHKDLNIDVNWEGVSQDWTRDEIASTPALRMRWHHDMRQELERNGYNVAELQDNHVLIESYLNAKHSIQI